jgi:hypothetical protein
VLIPGFFETETLEVEINTKFGWVETGKNPEFSGKNKSLWLGVNRWTNDQSNSIKLIFLKSVLIKKSKLTEILWKSVPKTKKTFLWLSSQQIPAQGYVCNIYPLGMSIYRVFYYPGIESNIFNYPGTWVPDSGNTFFQKIANFPFKQRIMTEKYINLKIVEIKNTNLDWETLFGVYF